MDSNLLRVADAQIPVRSDIEVNVEVIMRAIDFAAAEQAAILLTPEGSLSGYTPSFNAAAVEQALAKVTVDNCLPEKGPCSAPSSAVSPTGEWVCRVDSPGEQFFV
jgi:hypothetical protein